MSPRAAGWGRVGGAPVQLLLRGGYRGRCARRAARCRGARHLFPGGMVAALSNWAPICRASSGRSRLVAGSPGPRPRRRSAIGRARPKAALAPRGSNLYLRADAAVALIGTPLTLIGHVGHSQGSEGLGPRGLGAGADRCLLGLAAGHRLRAWAPSRSASPGWRRISIPKASPTGSCSRGSQEMAAPRPAASQVVVSVSFAF